MGSISCTSRSKSEIYQEVKSTRSLKSSEGTKPEPTPQTSTTSVSDAPEIAKLEKTVSSTPTAPTHHLTLQPPDRGASGLEIIRETPLKIPPPEKGTARKRKQSISKEGPEDSPLRNSQWKSYIEQDSLFSSAIKHHVKDLPEVAWIYSSQTLEEALEVMSQNRLSALPVVNPTNGVYIGFVTVVDILSKVAFSVKFISSEEARTGVMENLKKLKSPLVELINGKKSPEPLVLRSETDLLTVMGYLAEGIDQVLILSDDDPTTITQWRKLYASSAHFSLGSTDEKFEESTKITLNQSETEQVTPLRAHAFRQLDAIALFRKYHEDLGAIKGAKLNELDGGIGKRKVEGVLACDSVLVSFRNMVIRSQETAPVLDDNDSVVGTLSVTDLRGLTPRSMQDILLPVAEFLKKSRSGNTGPISPLREEALWDVKTEPDSSIPESDQFQYYVMGDGTDFGIRYGIRNRNGICSPNDTLEHVLVQVLKDKLTRLWLVENDKPVGEISLTKIIAAIYVDRLHPPEEEEEGEEE